MVVTEWYGMLKAALSDLMVGAIGCGERLMWSEKRFGHLGMAVFKEEMLFFHAKH